MLLEKYATVAVVDIETLATTEDSRICSIGAVVVDLNTNKIVDNFYHAIEHEGQHNRLRHEGTFIWWQNQAELNPKAHYEIFGEDVARITLEDGLSKFNGFLRRNCGKRPLLFGNGPEFDNKILEHAMRQNGIQPSWDHGCNQSIRTAVWFGRLFLDYDPKYEENTTTSNNHHALDDAKHEADYLIKIVNNFKSKLDV